MSNAQGRTVVVTGAASGIGRAAAERVLADGGIVVGADLAEPACPLDTAADRWIGVAADATDGDAMRALVARAVEASPAGRLDGAVTAAGVAGGGPVHLLPDEEWHRVLGVNATGTFLIARAALAQMVEQAPVDGERGSIVTIASIEGLEGTAGGSAYNASKGAVVLLTKNIAIDYGRLGIRANAICPGFIETPMTESIFGMPGMEGPYAAITEEHKLGRLGQPSEIASVAAFLLGPDASFVSGQALAVDGGYLAGRDHGVVELLGLT